MARILQIFICYPVARRSFTSKGVAIILLNSMISKYLKFD